MAPDTASTNIDFVLVPLAEGELCGDRNFSFNLFVVVIRRGIPVVYAPKAVGGTGIEENGGYQ
jgi:hypothetical protein